MLRNRMRILCDQLKNRYDDVEFTILLISGSYNCCNSRLPSWLFYDLLTNDLKFDESHETHKKVQVKKKAPNLNCHCGGFINKKSYS